MGAHCLGLRGCMYACKASFKNTQVPKLKVNGDLKLDRQGQPTFEPIERGKHHWTEERWFEKARLFLETQGVLNPS